jgi:hypothetical protein
VIVPSADKRGERLWIDEAVVSFKVRLLTLEGVSETDVIAKVHVRLCAR